MRHVWQSIQKVAAYAVVAGSVCFLGKPAWAGGPRFPQWSVPKVEAPKLKTPRISVPPVQTPKVSQWKPPQVRVSTLKPPSKSVKLPQMQISRTKPPSVSLPKPAAVRLPDISRQQRPAISVVKPKSINPPFDPRKVSLPPKITLPDSGPAVRRMSPATAGVKMKPLPGTVGSRTILRPSGTVRTAVPRVSGNDVVREGKHAGRVIGVAGQTIGQGLAGGLANGRGGAEGGNTKTTAPAGDDDREDEEADDPTEVTGSF